MEKDEVAGNKLVREFVADNKQYLMDGKELVVRTGAAEVIDKPERVEIDGTITAPAKFFEARKELHDGKKCHVLINKLAGCVELYMDENSKYGHQITGTLQSNPELEIFKINTGKLYTIKELMDLLKFNRVFFTDKDENTKVVTQLQMFKAKVIRDIEAANNGRGTQRNVNNSELDHQINENFKLKMPLYKGEIDKTFSVEIGVTVSDSGAISTWLESRELKELQVSERERLISEQGDKFPGVVVLEV